MMIFCCIAILLFLLLLLFGEKSSRFAPFQRLLKKNLLPALVISLLYFLGQAIGTLRLDCILPSLPGTALIFCLAALGLTFAKSCPDYEPLPVVTCFERKSRRLRKLGSVLLFSALLVAALFMIDAISPIFFRLFHEPDLRSQAASSLPAANKFLAFPLLLAGAGVAEESMFRLFFQSLFRCIFKRSWAAIVLSALCFALYHLTPLNAMYQVYWQFPLSQFFSVFFAGLVFGVFYEKFGFETTVLGHTFSDYIGVLLMPG